MSFSIPLTGLAANDPVPGTYIEVQFAQGAASGANTTYAALLIANKLSAGDATADTVVYGPDTPVSVQNEQDVINRFGTGSEMHRLWRRFTAVNKDTPLYMLATSESGGTQATGSVTLSGTASGAGTLRVYVGDDFVDTPIASGDSISTIASAATVQINAKTEWAVTATSSSGTVTLTARQKGPRGNSIRYSAQILAPSSITTTVTPTAHTAMTNGSTLDSWTTALSTILPTRYYHIVCAAEDATLLGAVVTQVNTQALPTSDIRQRVFAGSVDSISNVTTLATGLNAARAEVVWMPSSDLTGGELAATAAAAYCLFEAASNFRCNWDFYGDASGDTWPVKPARATGVVPTRANVKSALNNGITPIATRGSRSTYIVKRVTSRSLNGSTSDYRIRDAHKVTVCDRFADELQAKISLQLAGKKIGDDPVSSAARPPGPEVATPRVLRALIRRLIRDYEEDDKVQHADDIIAGMIVQRETSPSTRLSARIPLQPVDILDQTAILVDQVA